MSGSRSWQSHGGNNWLRSRLYQVFRVFITERSAGSRSVTWRWGGGLWCSWGGFNLIQGRDNSEERGVAGVHRDVMRWVTGTGGSAAGVIVPRHSRVSGRAASMSWPMDWPASRQLGVIYIRYAAATAGARVLGQPTVHSPPIVVFLVIQSRFSLNSGILRGYWTVGRSSTTAVVSRVSIVVAVFPSRLWVLVCWWSGVTGRRDGLSSWFVSRLSPTVSGHRGSMSGAITDHGVPVWIGSVSVWPGVAGWWTTNVGRARGRGWPAGLATQHTSPAAGVRRSEATLGVTLNLATVSLETTQLFIKLIPLSSASSWCSTASALITSVPLKSVVSALWEIWILFPRFGSLFNVHPRLLAVFKECCPTLVTGIIRHQSGTKDRSSPHLADGDGRLLELKFNFHYKQNWVIGIICTIENSIRWMKWQKLLMHRKSKR